MTNFRGDAHRNESVVLSYEEAAWLLNDLCVRLGFCLPPKKLERLEANPPSDIDGFTRAVFVAEGMDPDTAERKIYRQVRHIIAETFERVASCKRGTADQ